MDHQKLVTNFKTLNAFQSKQYRMTIIERGI